VTVTDRPDSKQHSVLDQVADLSPAISARAAEIEAARRLPPDLLAELTAAGCFRLLLPQSHGGLGADLSTAMQVLEALSRADASVGWTVAIGAGSWVDLVGLPRTTFDALYAGGPDVIFAGAIKPSGVAKAAKGGYRVSGQWAFASGCEHAAYLFGTCIEALDGEQRMRTVLFTPDDVDILDTWHVSGLRGTGSHDFRAVDVLVPAERTYPTFEAEPCIDDAVVRIPPPTLFSLPIAGIALGIAQGALDDIVALATDKVPLFAGSALAASPWFQLELAKSDTEVRAAHGLLHALAEEVWETASAGPTFTLHQRARVRAAAAWATERAAAIVEGAYRAGGGSSLYEASPLQRRFRDINALTQHFLVRPETLTTAGAVFAGQDIDMPVF
jgi:alkylation response protein AidB-like acyl-CoA dehydrogenase